MRFIKSVLFDPTSPTHPLRIHAWHRDLLVISEFGLPYVAPLFVPDVRYKFGVVFSPTVVLEASAGERERHKGGECASAYFGVVRNGIPTYIGAN